MKRLLATLLLLATPAAAQYPTPTFQSTTILGTQSVAGASTLSGGGTLSGTWAGNPVYSGNMTQQGTSALNGNTTIGTNTTAASTFFNGPAGANRIAQWNTAGSARWRWLANATAESGSNAGSDMQLFSFSDAGASLGSQLLITRSNGNWSWNSNNQFTLPTYTFDGSPTVKTRFGNQLAIMPNGTYTIPAGSLAVGTAPILWDAALASSGVVTPTVFGSVMNIQIPSDTIQLDDTVTSNNFSPLWIAYNIGGPGDNPATATAQGQRNGFFVTAVHQHAFRGASTTNPSILGGVVTGQINSPVVGTATKGEQLWGMDIASIITNTVTSGTISGQVGVEIDNSNQSSIAADSKIGLGVHSSSGDITAGTRTDMLIETASAAGAVGFYCTICLGKIGSGPPFRTDGKTTIIGTNPWNGQDNTPQSAGTFTGNSNGLATQFQATAGVEFSRVLFNGLGDGTGMAFAAPGFLVDDLGAAYYGSGKLLGTTAGLTIDTPNYVLNGGAGVGVLGGSTVNKVFNNDLAWDTTCKVRGIYRLTVVGGVVTAVTVLRNPGCATNPATLVLISQNGGVTINGLTWVAPAAQSVQIGASSANVLVGTGSALATNATTGFLQVPSMAGAPTGNCGGAGGKACLVVDTTNKKVCYNITGTTWECSAAFTP